ncbi:hypothetical protein GCM10023091_05330 [Ravibacter arvi]|uniref:CHRD domain-containing protein n=1 Tax=Ravibacter arvi TaxID=2051041 RepID=A0ABP8LMW0_9BACT
MKRTLLVCFSAFLMFSGCKEEGPHLKDTLSYRANFSVNTVPITAQSEGSGTAALEYSKETGLLKYNLSLRDVKPTKVVIAFGDPNPWDIGPEIADISSEITENGGSGSLSLDPYLQREKLLSNYCYIRIDSEKFPYGELRGQIELVEEE